MKFTRLASNCKFKVNYEITDSTLEYLKCVLPSRHQLEDEFINHKYSMMVIESQWKNLTMIHHHLKMPLKQECITVHHLQHDQTSLYLNHKLLELGNKINRLNYIFQINYYLG